MTQEIAQFETERNYYVNIREFKGGAIEAVTKCVRPMQRESAKARWENFGMSGFKVMKDDEVISDFERQANWSRAVRRAKQSIRFLCKDMQADRLFTLTYRENVLDREQVKEDFTRFVRLARRELGEWAYVAVLERQDRGAYHIHCAVRGWQRIKVLRACWHEALGIKGSIRAIRNSDLVLAKGDDSPGNVDVTSPRSGEGRSGRSWRTDRLAGYVTKYLHKTFDETAAEKRRYWSAKEIKKPVPTRVWLGATNALEAIQETHQVLDLYYGLEPGFAMWLSDDQTCFWLGGRVQGAT